MNHRPYLRLAVAMLVGLAFCCPLDSALGQAIPVEWGAVGDPADFSVDTNWVGGLRPFAVFNESAVVNRGAEAFLDSDIVAADAPGGLTIGDSRDETGVVEIRSGGIMNVVQESVDFTTGATTVGAGGQGILRVLGGGTLNTLALNSGGQAGSGIWLEGTGVINVGAASNLDSALNITGPDATFTTDSLAFGGNHTYTNVLTSAGASTIGVTGNAALDGDIFLDFSGAPAPSAGDTWDLVQAGSVSGAFSSVNFVGANLLSGQKFLVNNVPSGGGTAVQLSLANVLVAEFNRDSGEILIRNPQGAAIDIDAIQIESASGSLNPGGNTPISGDWDAAGLSNNLIAQLNPSGSTSAASDLSLGNAQAPNLDVFGVHPDDHTFLYRTAGGQFVEGNVEYIGTEKTNNFVLTIDPLSGSGSLFNDSGKTIEIDGYTIKSASGSLDDAGFVGLGGDWVGSNNRPEQLTELNPEADGSATLGPGQSLALGQVWDPNGSQDLTFDFLFAPTIADPDLDPNSVQNGLVRYGAVVDPPDLLADLDMDGDVDGADWLEIQRQDRQDLVVAFNSEFGMVAASASAGAVPEPGSIALAACSALALLAYRRKRG